MSKKPKVVLSCLLSLGVLLLGWWLLGGCGIDVLNPRGYIADEIYGLIVFTCLLSLLVIVPVFILTVHIARKYSVRNGGKAARYSPDFHDSKLLEAIWWLIPLILIIILAVVTWLTSHSLDPYRPIASRQKPVEVQVIALNWKWLFIYPEEKIATVNYMQIPTGRPINFRLTADAPMNSFWVPQLGGQVYAMAGMQSQLHLMARQPGDYHGSSANLSGEGFSGMKFTVKATNDAGYRAWLSEVRRSGKKLTAAGYEHLAMPTKDNPPAYFASSEPGIYAKVIKKYTTPGGSNPEIKSNDAAREGVDAHHDAGRERH